MRVQWIVFNQAGFDAAAKFYPEADPKDFEVIFEGNVIDKYQTFWGTPKFIVELPDGVLTSVSMCKCKVVKEG